MSKHTDGATSSQHPPRAALGEYITSVNAHLRELVPERYLLDLARGLVDVSPRHPHARVILRAIPEVYALVSTEHGQHYCVRLHAVSGQGVDTLAIPRNDVVRHRTAWLLRVSHTPLPARDTWQHIAQALHAIAQVSPIEYITEPGTRTASEPESEHQPC